METGQQSYVPLYIVGPLSTDAGLLEGLKALSGYNIHSIAPPIKYPADFILSEFTTNVGLALRESGKSSGLMGKLNIELTRKKPDTHHTYDTYESLAINLLPHAYQPWRPSSRQILSVSVPVLAAILIIPFYNIVSAAMDQTAVMETRYKNLNNELERRKLEIKNREPLIALINEYNSITTTAGYLDEDLSLIREIAGNLSVQLTSVTHAGKTIDISCEADNGILRQYASALQDSGRFVKVKFPEDFWVYPFPSSVNLELESKMGK